MTRWRQAFRAAVGVIGLLLLTGMPAKAQEPTRTVEIHAYQYGFKPAEITLKKGETVKLVLWSDDVPHSLAVQGLPIHAEMLKDHETDVIVTPTEAGDFAGKCSKFCGSGHRDMHFTVHVVN
jgi:cytochrome c oxidase subunit II